MKVCTAEQMRQIDRTAEEMGGIPSIVLMENAAMACVREIEKLSSVKRIGIFCGKGNNGGDGFAIARHLFNMGYITEIFLVCGTDFANDALINYEIVEKMGIRITQITDSSDLEYYISVQDLVVDAIFGTGIRGEISGIAYDTINFINNFSKKIMSVDIPSGVNSDTGEICSVAVKADITVTFAAYKRGMFLYPGADCMGKAVVADISIPEYIIKECNIDTEAVGKAEARKLLPKRCDNSHKGDYGKILIVGGSKGMTGAAALAGSSAVKSGAGLVTVGIAESLNSVLEVKLTEAMTLPLPDDNGSLNGNASELIFEQMQKSDVLLIGPGLGRSKETKKLVCDILTKSRIPVVVDADALFAVSENSEIINSCGCNLIFTPHEAEFARLLGISVKEVAKNRSELSREFATANGVTLILKGKYTIVTSPSGRQYINTVGNSGMATGGSGDVLAGMTAAFTASVGDETKAAVLAVYLHGLAGDKAAEKYGKISLTATDICNNIHEAITDITAGKMQESML